MSKPVLTPEIALMHQQFTADVINALESKGFHILDLTDAILCIQQLCDNTNLLELKHHKEFPQEDYN